MLCDPRLYPTLAAQEKVPLDHIGIWQLAINF